MEKNNNIIYSDIELLSFMEHKGIKNTYSGLINLKENIDLYKDEINDWKLSRNKKPQEKAVLNEAAPVVENKVPKTNTVKPSVSHLNPNRTVNKVITESYTKERHANEFLKIFLVEECGMTLNEFEILSTGSKIDSIKELAKTVLANIETKLSQVDTSIIDRSRGDIKALKELPILQDAITQLESLIERDENSIPEYGHAVGVVIKAILCVNQYSNVFKEAYRNKKSLMILKYESVLLNIISSVSYILSTIVDYKANYLSLKRNVEGLMNFAPLKSLEEFINSVEKGEFKIIASDVSTLREYYLEIPVEKMSNILEAVDYLPMVINGIKDIYQNVTGSGKVSNLLYKAVGTVVLLFSLRDTFYTFFRMKTKISDMVAGIQNFAGINNGGNVLQKLSQFSSKFKTDAENSSDICKREIEDENRGLLNQVKKLQNQNTYNNYQAADGNQDNNTEAGTQANADNIFGFDF